MQCSRLSGPVHSALIWAQYITPPDLSALPISGKTSTARLRQDRESRRAKLGRGYKGSGTGFEMRKGKVAFQMLPFRIAKIAGIAIAKAWNTALKVEGTTQSNKERTKRKQWFCHFS